MEAFWAPPGSLFGTHARSREGSVFEESFNVFTFFDLALTRSAPPLCPALPHLLCPALRPALTRSAPLPSIALTRSAPLASALTRSAPLGSIFGRSDPLCPAFGFLFGCRSDPLCPALPHNGPLYPAVV